MTDEDYLLAKSKKEYLDFMKDAVASYAPGRIEFLGNHLDYNGGCVLGMAIDAGIHALGVPKTDSSFELFSDVFEGAKISGSLEKLEKQTGEKKWGNYCIGIIHVLQEMGLAPSHGFSLTLTSDLPMSAGLSSSAAVELATALSLLQLAGKKISKKELVMLCRKAENKWVGLPCGILDQGTSTFGETNRIVRIDCEGEEFSTLPLPSNTCLWIFDTGIKHDLIDSLYGTRNKECLDALGILRRKEPELKSLANCPSELLRRVKLPEILGKRSLHVVEEQARVQQFVEGLNEGKSPRTLGPLLYESHRSSSLLFENSLPQLDFLVDSLMNEPDVYGARLTGGGFGGAVLAWTSQAFDRQKANSVAKKYQESWQDNPSFNCFLPSEGAGVRNPIRN